MLRKQNYRCAICEVQFSAIIKGYVDHDHATGQVRALCCQHCNSLLGFSRDNIYTLHLAADYLERYQGV